MLITWAHLPILCVAWAIQFSLIVADSIIGGTPLNVIDTMFMLIFLPMFALSALTNSYTTRRGIINREKRDGIKFLLPAIISAQVIIRFAAFLDIPDGVESPGMAVRKFFMCMVLLLIGCAISIVVANFYRLDALVSPPNIEAGGDDANAIEPWTDN